MLTRKSMALVAALSALAVLAVGATSASATQVKPENEAITLTNVGNTIFIPGNAWAQESLQCEKSEAEFTVPDGKAPPLGITANTNREGEGETSTGSGSVNALLSPSPTFEECDVYVDVNGVWVNTNIPVTVTTQGQWSLSATQNELNNEKGGSIAIAIPPEGASIVVEAPEGNCTLTVPLAGRANSVNSEYTNANRRAVVDGQVDFASAPAGCAGPSPAQFEGVYEANKALEVIN